MTQYPGVIKEWVLQAVRGKDFVVTDTVLAELVAAKPIPRQRMRGFGD